MVLQTLPEAPRTSYIYLIPLRLLGTQRSLLASDPDTSVRACTGWRLSFSYTQYIKKLKRADLRCYRWTRSHIVARTWTCLRNFITHPIDSTISISMTYTKVIYAITVPIHFEWITSRVCHHYSEEMHPVMTRAKPRNVCHNYDILGVSDVLWGDTAHRDLLSTQTVQGVYKLTNSMPMLLCICCE